MASTRFKQALTRVEDHTGRFMTTSVEVIDQIHLELKRKDWRQADLAKALGKSEAEISKWLTPGHNFTLRTLAKVEAALGATLLNTPLRHDAERRAGRESEADFASVYRNERATAEAMTTQTQWLTKNLDMPDVFPSIADTHFVRIKLGTEVRLGSDITWQNLFPGMEGNYSVAEDRKEEESDSGEAGTPSHAMAA